MPKITSSSRRSSRTSSRPVTSGNQPQRRNRQNVSNARITTSNAWGRGKQWETQPGDYTWRRSYSNGSNRVTNGSQRTNTGSARVTGGERLALPPGRKGGPLVAGGAKPKRPALPGSPNPPRLPGGTGGADRVRGSGVRTGQPGPNRLQLPEALKRQINSLNTPARPGSVAGSVARGVGEAAILTVGTPIAAAIGRRAGQALGNALKPVGRAIDDRLPGINSKDEQRRRDRAKPLPQMTAAERARAVRLEQATPTSNPPRRSSTSSQSSGGSSRPAPSRAPQRPAASQPPAPRQPMEKAYGDSGKDLYMASKKNNPLMQRTFGYQTGGGPGRGSDGPPNPNAEPAPSAAELKILDKIKQAKANQKK